MRMRKAIKKVIAIVLSMLCMFSLVSCGNNNEQQAAPQVEDKSDVTFEGTNMEFEGLEGNIIRYTMKNEKLYMLTESETDSGEEQPAKSYRFYSSDSDGNNLKIVPLENVDGEEVVLFCVDAACNIIYMAVHNNDGKQAVCLVKIDSEGTELERKEITNIVKDNVELVSGIVSDDKEQTVLACNEKVYFFNGQFESLGELQAQEGKVVDMALAKNGEIVCVIDELLNSGQLSIKVYILNTKSKQWGDTIDIRTGEYQENDYVMDGAEYDFYYKGRNGIYGYDIETNTPTEIMDYDASYMTSLDAEGMICIGGDRFIGKADGFTDGKAHTILVAYEKKDMNTGNNKEVITLGTYYADFNIKSAVAKFNRSDPEYQIIIEDYRDMDESRILADIAAGKGQDIMDLNACPLTVEQCISKGIIEELTPYYDKDPDINADDMIASVREAMEYDGRLYYVAPRFALKGMAARTEDVGNAAGWNIADLKALMEKKGKDVGLFRFESIKSSYMMSLLQYSISDYIDWEKGTCSFDSEDFKYILELCNEKGLKEEEDATEAEIVEEVNSKFSKFQNGEYVLLEEDELSLSNIQLERKALGKDITYIGFPNKEKQGIYFEFPDRFAISSQSKKKEKAWEFIRSFLLPENQKSTIVEYNMPVSQEMFDAKLKALTATEAYVDEFGELVEPEDEYTVEYGGMDIVMGVPTQEDVDTYLSLISQARRCSDIDAVVINIIWEETENYFKGKRKLDKTVDAIQSRVMTYMSEQKK